jgi:hypothetical protein
MLKRLISLAALALLQPLAAAQPVAAQQAAADPFEQVLEAIDATTPREAVLESSVRALEASLRLNPAMAALERQRPGVIETTSAAARPTLASYIARLRAEYRPRYVAVLRQHLTADEASEIAGFFESPIGQKLIAATVDHYQGQAAAAALAQGNAITSSEVRQDASAAAGGALANLDAADSAEVIREAASRPALLKLDPVRAEFNELRAQMDREPMSAAEQAMLQEAIRSALGAR